MKSREPLIVAVVAALLFAIAALIVYFIVRPAHQATVTISGLELSPTPTNPPPTITPTPVTRDAASFPITITDGVGRRVAINALPQRIISVGPGLTEWVFDLGAGQQVVGDGASDVYPDAAQNVPQVGDERNPDADKIAALKPDLVILSDNAAARDAMTALEGKGIATLLFAPADIARAIAEGQALGQALGVSATANTLGRAMQVRLDAVRAKVSGHSKRPLVFYEVDASNLDAPLTVAPNSFVASMILAAGGSNYVNATALAQPTPGNDNLDAALAPTQVISGSLVAVKLSDLQQRPPDIIILGDASVGITADEVKSRSQAWQNLVAVKNGKLYPIDDALLRPGPRCVDGLEQLNRMINGE